MPRKSKELTLNSQEIDELSKIVVLVKQALSKNHSKFN